MSGLGGTTALVTGGASGIGLGVARALAEAGADVAIWSIDGAQNDETLDALGATGRRVHAEVCDVTEEAQVVASFARTVEALGGIDAVVTSAGVGGGTPLRRTSLASWRRLLAVNLDGTFLTLREAARHQIERGEGGALVAVSSMVVNRSAPRQAAYAASKTAVLGLVRSLAVELARHDIRVNALLPGWTDTAMLGDVRDVPAFQDATVGRTPMRRLGTPEDMAAAAVFLADKSQTFHTGDTVLVDGGFSAY